MSDTESSETAETEGDEHQSEDAIVHAQLTISPGHTGQVELAVNDVAGILAHYGVDDPGTAVV